MQLHALTNSTCRHGNHVSRPLFAPSTRARLLVASARSRKTATSSQDDSASDPETAEPAAAPAAAAAAAAALPPLVRSSRRATPAAAGRNRRASSQTPRPALSPAQELRAKGVVATSEDGTEFVNIACLGQGQPHWYALSLLENKEDTFIATLGPKLAAQGYSIAPSFFTPHVPPTAAEANAEAAAAAAAALEDANALLADAQEWWEASQGGPGEAGAAARVKDAEAGVAAAARAVEGLAAAAAAAGEAAAASEAMLGRYDVVFWKPRKVMEVYSHNTDKLVEREVAFSRGTGGAILLMHCRLDPVLAEAVSTTYFFLDWRDYEPLPGVLLKQHGMLPEEAELDDMWKLPEPCTQSFLLQLSNWQHTREAEDLEKERQEYYGSGAGDPFGARPEKGAKRDDSTNPSRWSVSAGPTNAGAAALIAAGEPLPWEQFEQEQQQEYGRGRGRGRSSRGGGPVGAGGRGGRGGGRQQQWQQQGEGAGQYQGQGYGRQPQQQFAAAQGSGFEGSDGGGWDGGRGRGGRGGRGGRQQQQQPWQQRQEWQQQPPPPRYGQYAVAAAGSVDSDGGDRSGGEEDGAGFGEQNRMRQMDWMEELGGSRYRDSEDAGDMQQDYPPPRGQQGRQGGSSSYDNSSRWQQQQQPRQQWQQQRQGAAGQDGGTTRMRQLDFTGDMGSDRYSDDEGDGLDYDRLEGLDGTRQQQQQQQQQQQRGMGGGRDSGLNMQQQLGFMAEMGSDRYSDSDEGDAAAAAAFAQPPSRAAGGGRASSSSSSGNFSDLLSEFADAMEYMTDDGTSSFQGAAAGSAGLNNAAGGQQGGWQQGDAGTAANPGRASFMDEETMDWGMSGGVEEGAAAAREVLQEWQSEGFVPAPGAAAAAATPSYNADISTRSQEGLGASFEFEAGPGLASADSLLGQLPAFEAELRGAAGAQQQQQQQEVQPPPAAAAAKRKSSRAGTSSRRGRKTEEVGAAEAAVPASGRRKTSTRKAAAAGPADAKKKQKGAAAAAAADVPLDGWVGGGADAADEGFEEGWVDRMMDDGNDRVAIDDVMRSS